MRNQTLVEQIPFPPASLSHGNFVKARAFYGLLLWHLVHGDERIDAHSWATVSGVKQSSLYVLAPRWFRWKYIKEYGMTPGRPGPRNFSYELETRGIDYFEDMRYWYVYRQAAINHVLKVSNVTVWWRWRTGICYLTFPWATQADYHFTSDRTEMQEVLGRLMACQSRDYQNAMFSISSFRSRVGADLAAFLKQTQGPELERAEAKARALTGKTAAQRSTEDWRARARRFFETHQGEGEEV